MKILVTGGAGFIGRHLVKHRSNTSHIVVLDNLHRVMPGQFAEGIEFREADIRDRSAVENAMDGCEVVFHLAAQSNVMGAIADADYAFSSNVAGTYNVLQAALKERVKRLVFPSSREVCGDPKRVPVRESSPLRPKNAYGTSKVAGEAYCGLAAREGLDTAVLRLANVYGPGDRDRVIPLFADAAASGEPLTVFGEGKVLDFVWIGTVVDALVKAGLGRRSIRGPVNVGSGKGVTIAELARRVVQLSGSSSPVRIVPEREQEVGRFVADITRGKRVLGIEEPDDSLWGLAEMLAGRSTA
jgi:nucleoside-diphosphate-sugar epimerase